MCDETYKTETRCTQHCAQSHSDSEFLNFKSIDGQITSVPVQKFKPGSCKVANVKSKANASQGAAWSTKSKDMDVKKQFGKRQIDSSRLTIFSECAPASLKS